MFDDLPRDCFDNFSLSIVDYLSGFGHHLSDGSCFVIHNFLFIWNIFDSTGAYITQTYLTFDNRTLLHPWPCQLTDLIGSKPARLVSVHTRSCVNMFIGHWVRWVCWGLIVKWWWQLLDGDVRVFLCEDRVFGWGCDARSVLGHI